MNWWTLGGLVVGIIIGFIAACRAFIVMQNDLVSIFTKPPKEK